MKERIGMGRQGVKELQCWRKGCEWQKGKTDPVAPWGCAGYSRKNMFAAGCF
jgi:hypothetical protein